MTEETEDDIFSQAVSAVKHNHPKKALGLLKKIGPNSPYYKQCIPLKAECFFQRGFLPSAIQILKKFLDTEKTYLPALRTITLCLYKLKEYPDALVYANRFLEIDDSVEEIVSIKNTCQRMSEGGDGEEPELGITNFSKHMKHPDWRNLMWDGTNLKKNGDLEKALEKFEAVYLLKPGNVTALEHIISILEELGMHEKLVREIDERIEIGHMSKYQNFSGLTTQAELFQAREYKTFLTMKVKALMKLKRFHEALDSVMLLERASSRNSKTVKSMKVKSMKYTIKEKLGYTLDVRSLLNIARKYYKEKKWEDARKTYDSIILLMPSNITSAAFKAQCLAELKKYKEAIECCEKAESVTPHSKIAMSFLLRVKGEIYLKDGNPNEASGCIRMGIRLDPTHKTIRHYWNILGKALYESERWEDAAKCYAECANLDPENAWHLYWRSRCLDKSGKLDEAIECINMAIGKNRKNKPSLFSCYQSKGVILSKKSLHEDAIECFDLALKIKPDNPFVLVSKGVPLAFLGSLKDCLECFDKALRAKPDNFNFWKAKYYAMGILGEPLEDFKCAENMLRIEPDRFDSKLAMATAMSVENFSMPNHTRTERLEKALRFVDDALSIDKNEHVFFRKAIILKELEEYDDALQTLEDGLSLEPDNTSLLHMMGVVLYYYKRKYEDADKYFDRAIELAPETVRYWKSKVKLLKMWEQYDDVISTCADALKYHPTDGFFWWQKGSALAKKGNHPEAVDCYDEALKLDPYDVFCMNKKGKSLIEMNEFGQAIDCLKEAKNMDAGNDQVVSNLGYAYEKKGDYDTAKECYDAAIDLKPDIFHFSRKAWLCSLRKEYGEAAENYECCVEINPGDPVALALKADALYNWEWPIHLDESLEICKDLNEREISEQETRGYNSHNIDTVGTPHHLALTVMSKIYHDKKMFSESVDCCDKILRSDPTKIEILHIKATSLLEMENYNEANSCTQEIERLQGKGVTEVSASKETLVARMKELERVSDERKTRIDELEAGKEKGTPSYRSIAGLSILEIIDPAKKNSESNFLEFKSSMQTPIDVITGEVEIIAQGEKDRKKELRWKISETMAGFMNTGGGVLIIGYYDGDNPRKSTTKRVIGLEKDYTTLGKKKDWDGWNLAFSELLSTDFSPSVLDCIQGPTEETYNGELEQVEGKGTLAKIVVKKSDGAVFFGKDGEFAVREGNRTRCLSPKETAEYISSHFKG